MARQVAYRAGLGDRVPGATFNQACASGLLAIETAADRIRLAFRIALTRPPDEQEARWSAELLQQHTKRYRQSGSTDDEAGRKALMHLCRVLFNSSEFLYVE